jgi:peptide/nickel transport system permease protein
VKLTLLATDALFFALIAAVLAYAWYAARHEHLKAPWREVAKNSLAMSAAVVLLVFLLIGVLDSIHFYPRLEAHAGAGEEIQHGTEVISLFDRLA